MERSFDPEIFREAVLPYPDMISPGFDFKGWLSEPRHVMYHEDGSIGLCTFEYPGLYTVHWYFKVRGKAAFDLARRMLDDLFSRHDAKAVRGLTQVHLKAAKFAARKIGMKSLGTVRYPDGDYELLYMTKEDFYYGRNC